MKMHFASAFQSFNVILICILIYMWVINGKIYFYCLLCVVVLTTDKDFPPCKLEKFLG